MCEVFNLTSARMDRPARAVPARASSSATTRSPTTTFYGPAAPRDAHRRRRHRGGRRALRRPRPHRRRARPDVVVDLALRARRRRALTVLGMNAAELARNPMATASGRPRPQRRPARCRSTTTTFDAVTCCVSVDYLTRPVEVFADVARVLRAGGLLRVHVLQPVLPDQGDQGLAGQRRHGAAGNRAGVLRASGAFGEPTLAHCNPGAPGDPLYAAWAAAVSATRALEAEVVDCRACPRLVAWREQVARSTSGRPSVTRRTGDGRCRASVIRRRRSSCSGWHRRPTAPTAPAGSSPATAAATSCSPRCTASASPTSRCSVHAGDGLALHGAWVTAAVKCAPPANAPTPAERDACAPFLRRELAALDPIVVVCLGAFGYEAACRLLRRAAAAALRTRRRARHRRRAGARVLVPPEPAEHVHRPPHPGHARRRLHPGHCAGSGVGVDGRVRSGDRRGPLWVRSLTTVVSERAQVTERAADRDDHSANS